MADRCLFFEDLVRSTGGRQRTFQLHSRPEAGLVCVDLRLREGADWCFARRWIRTDGGQRELYRTIDRLESLGFRFHVAAQGRTGLTPRDLKKLPEADRLDVRASLLLAGLTPEERRIHGELFPEEQALLARGYDWDGQAVYREGKPIAQDAHGRVLDVDGEILYEWVHVPDEFTWRRYPLERRRTEVTLRGT